MKWSVGKAGSDRESELKDTDNFPFGKHGPKGDMSCTMGEVPAAYFDWLLGQPWLKEWPAVAAYIEKNKKAIDQDLERAARPHSRRLHDEGYQSDPDDDIPF